MSFGWIKQLVPKAVRPKIRRAWDRLRHRGTDYFCPICSSPLREFQPWSGAPNFRCPVCISKPPHRLAHRYFQLHPELFTADEMLVHIAPEPELRLAHGAFRQTGMQYRSGDLSGSGDEKLDVRNLPFADQSVRLLYCCHVLNMIQEDRQAMSEIFRIMQPQGVALLQVPAYYRGERTLEPRTREERKAAFHDEDIQRCYTDADYVSRLNDAGFRVEHFRATDQADELVRQLQLKEEVLHVCRRSESKL